MIRRSNLAVLALGMLLAVAGVQPAFGQAGRAEMNGTVYDAAKAVLPGATVTVTHEETGVQRTVTANDAGRFVIPTLSPGVYTVTVEMPGFQTQTRRGLPLSVGQELTVDFSLSMATLAEEVTVTGEAPVVEVTTNRIGTNITNEEIDSLPSAARNQMALMQLVPGLTPSLDSGQSEGGQYNANGRETGSNVFLIDGLSNYSVRNGGGFGGQARLTLDSMSEFQVLTHQYGAEYGGSAGVVVNAVSRGGTNRLSGRGFYYFQDESMNAQEHFAKRSGEDKPESGSKIYGFNIGGPIVKNKAFWFFNLERNEVDSAVTLVYPPEAAPLATNYSDAGQIRALNSFVRGDYHISPSHSLSVKYLRQRTYEAGDEWVPTGSTRDNIELEDDSGDTMFNASWTWVIGTRATNELRFGDVRQAVLTGPRAFFDGQTFVGPGNRDQFDIGSNNEHPDYSAGPRPTYGIAEEELQQIEDVFTFTTAGAHTWKAGFTYGRPAVEPAISGTNWIGSFAFLQNQPFDPANPSTYPSRFQIRLGEIFFTVRDTVFSTFVQDKWQPTKNLTLNLGVRYERQDLVPQTKNAFAPRVGISWDPLGDGRTVVRGGVGKFYETQLIGVGTALAQNAVISPAFVFDTGEDRSALSGRIPTRHVCLQPVGSGGLALISPACRAALEVVRDQVAAGGFINNQPTVDGDRHLGYLWSYSVGVERQIAGDMAFSVDYVGNRGYDQTALIDINEPRLINGTLRRPGVDGFDPDGTLIPPQARGTTFRRVLQFQTLDALDSDYNALETSVEKRYSNNWSARIGYTLARARNVGVTGGRSTNVQKRLDDDLNPRSDYGRANFDNRHQFNASFNANVWRGFGAGAVFSYYSGFPINETVGTDVNGDLDNFDRPVQGRDDASRPIVSPLDASGKAIRNGIDGENVVLLDLRFQYVLSMPRRSNVGLFWEIYNATNRVNFANGSGNRRSSNFLVPVATSRPPRTMQLGIRYTF
ncbi:MAG TPA: TonB-dependent receptor [Vicinamibacterales bacterium]|nr:TonB-dependent receptor [Vicinamibacterales bacterium]